MEEEKLFCIGDVAKMFHISTGTLRHYERIGIIVPEFIEEKSIFSKVDKVGSLRPRSIDLMCRKDKPDFSANCSCFNFRERRNKRIVIPKDF